MKTTGVNFLTKLAAFMATVAMVNCTPVIIPDAATVSPAMNTTSTPLARRGNECLGSSFVDEWHPDAPLISDCEALMRKGMDSKYMIWIWGPWRTLVEHGTCAFKAIAGEGGGGNIGDIDIRELLRDSIRDRGRDGRVQTAGMMECCCTYSEIHWSISRP